MRHTTKGTLTMKLKLDNQHLFILCNFLIAVTISCNSQGQSNKEIIQAKNNTQPIESKIDTTRLKYTSAVRSILEDSKGNIWFGSYNEGVCLLNNGNVWVWALLRYDAKSLYSNEPTVTEIMSQSVMLLGILEDAKGNIWFGSGGGAYRYDGKTITDFKSKEGQ